MLTKIAKVLMTAIPYILLGLVIVGAVVGIGAAVVQELKAPL